MVHDYWFQLENRRIRETYSWEAIMRHEQWIARALRSRRERYWEERLMSQSFLDQLIVNWLIEKRGAYYNEQGELCLAGEVFTKSDYNQMITEMPMPDISTGAKKEGTS